MQTKREDDNKTCHVNVLPSFFTGTYLFYTDNSSWMFVTDLKTIVPAASESGAEFVEDKKGW